MAKKSNVPSAELQGWYDKIRNAEDRREDIARRYGWERLTKELKGLYKDIIPQMKGTPIIPINLVHGFMRTAIPSLYFRDPKLAVNPQGIAYLDRAKIVEPVLNHTWTRLRLKGETKKCIGDTLIFGHSWMKFGQTAVVGPAEPEAEPKKKGSIAAKLPQYSTDTIIKDSKVWAYRVSPKDVVFNNDESIDPPYDCRWIAHRIPKPLETVKAMFPGNDDLEASFYTGGPQSRQDQDRKNRPMPIPADGNLNGAVAMVNLYEVTDFDSMQVFYLVLDHPRVLSDPKAFPYEFNGFNYSMLKFNPVPDEPYPYGDLYAAEPQMWEIIKLVSMALNHVKRFSRQLCVEENTLNASEKAKFEQGIDGAIIEYKKGTNQSGGPMPIPYPPIQTDLYNIVDRLQLLFDSIVGQSAFDRGSTTATKTRTLGEVDKIQRSTGARASEKVDIVEDFCEEVARKLLALKKQFTDVPEFVSVTGLDPQMLNRMLKAPVPALEGRMADETGFFFTKEDIVGEYDVNVVAGSTKPLDVDSRNELLTQLLRFGQALGLQPGDPASNEIGRELFSGLDMYGVAKAYEDKLVAAGLRNQVQMLAQKRDQLVAQLQQLQQKGQQMQAQMAQMQAQPPMGVMPQ